jgi:acetaldehyde dehydrogenase
MPTGAAGRKVKAAIVGRGNTGTDLIVKMLRRGNRLEVVAPVGITRISEKLAIGLRHQHPDHPG